MDNCAATRISALRQLMKRFDWDAVIIKGSDPHCSEYTAPRWQQVEWISGYTGEGDIVVTQDHAGLWTDTRYFIQAEKQLRGTGIQLHKMRVPDQVPIPRWLAQETFTDLQADITITVDGLCTSQSFVDEIKQAFADSGRKETSDEECARLDIFNCPDLLDLLWEDRPEIPCSPIITLSPDLAGETRTSKIEWLRQQLVYKSGESADTNTTVIISALDEIAWLLNIRGADIEYNPVALSYMVITKDRADWYVKKSGPEETDAETLASFEELEKDHIRILDYNELSLEAETFRKDTNSPVLVDAGTINFDLASKLEETGCEVRYTEFPTALRKAVKNEVEISGMRDAHVEDGVAMELFLYWVENKLDRDDRIDEKAAADKLHSLRASIPGFMSESFETISAYGSNAALPHYVTPATDSAVLNRSGLYLCDSGGQYTFGTTDITRTIPLGPCTALEKEDYTLVLKGHIALAMAKFPYGTAGCQLDVLAREPLWARKRNFGHGTGHGVGFFLNVHEGPQDIRQNFNPCPILPGMITSDEPGIYREHLHGIRHENLLLCVSDGNNDFGSWLRFEPLTLCHFDTSIILPHLLTKEEIKWLNDYNSTVYNKLANRLPVPVAEWLRAKTAEI